MRLALIIISIAIVASRIRNAESFSSDCRRLTQRAAFTRAQFWKASRLYSSEPSWGEEAKDYSQEETLLCIDLSVRSGVEVDDALAAVSRYCQSFPFAAVLPVQPLQYLPVQEDGGVEVKFLRKKTDIKSGVDGGIRFFIDTVAAEDDDDDEDDDKDLIVIKAKRNSKGQVIAKLMAEKLVVTSFVAGITGEEDKRFGKPPTDLVDVKSIYHKWMVAIS